jgi:hypothetical protein
MPRALDGTYSLPPGTIVATGDTILPSQHNPAMQDIASALTGSMPRTGGSFTGLVNFAAGIAGGAVVNGGFNVTGSGGYAGNFTAKAITITESLGVGTQLFVNGPGDFVGNVSANSFIPTSDRRLKTDIQTLDGATMLRAVRRIGGRQYVKAGSPELGVIAQDVQNAGLGAVVAANDRDGMLGVNYSALVGVLFAAVSYLADQVDQLKGGSV